MPHRYVVLVPIKAGSQPKSRLDAGNLRTQAMQAFARDAIAAAQACDLVSEVLVISARAQQLGENGWLPDAGSGLNAALEKAAVEVSRTHPDRGIVAMLGDLPCLTAADLSAVLRFGLSQQRWFVADHHGTGTTMLGAAPGQLLLPRFGEKSAHEHQASGATACELEVISARIDIDTRSDLDIALAHGVGVHTRNAFGAGQLSPTSPK